MSRTSILGLTRFAQAHKTPSWGQCLLLTSSEGDHGCLAFACTIVSCHLHFVQATRVESGEGQAVLAGRYAGESPVVGGVCDLLEKVAGIRTGISAQSGWWLRFAEKAEWSPTEQEEKKASGPGLGRVVLPRADGSCQPWDFPPHWDSEIGSAILHLTIPSKKILCRGSKGRLLLKISPKTSSLYF